MNSFKPNNRYVNVDKNGNLSIAEGIELEEVLSKLHYYELVEASSKSNSICWKLYGKYPIDCRNYEEFQRYVYAYNLPIKQLLKKYPGVTKRTLNALNRNEIKYVKDFINTKHGWSWSIIDKITGVGKQQYLIIFKALMKLKHWTYYGYDENGNAEFFNEEE